MKKKFISIFFLLVCCIIFANQANLVTSYNLNTECIEEKEFYSVVTYKASPVTIMLNNKQDVCLANILPVYVVGKGYVRAEFLQKDDEILYLDNETVITMEIKKIKKEWDFKTFSTYVDVKDNSNYFTNNILVHNINSTIFK